MYAIPVVTLREVVVRQMIVRRFGKKLYGSDTGVRGSKLVGMTSSTPLRQFL